MSLPSSFESRLRELAEPTVKQLYSKLIDIFISCCAEHLTQQTQGSVTEPLNLTIERCRNALTITQEEQSRADDLTSTTVVLPPTLPSQWQQTATNFSVDNVSQLPSRLDAHLNNTIETGTESHNTLVPLLANNSQQTTQLSTQAAVSHHVDLNRPIKDLLNANDSISLLHIESTALQESVTKFPNVPLTEQHPTEVSCDNHINSSAALAAKGNNNASFEAEIPSPTSVEEITFEPNFPLVVSKTTAVQPREKNEIFEHETESEDEYYEIVDQIGTESATVVEQNLTLQVAAADHDCTGPASALDNVNENTRRRINSMSSDNEMEECVPAKRIKTVTTTLHESSVSEPSKTTAPPLLSIRLGSIETNVNSAFDIVVPHSETAVRQLVLDSGQSTGISETTSKALKRQRSFPTASCSHQRINQPEILKASTSKAKSSDSTGGATSHSPLNRSLSETSSSSRHSLRVHQSDSHSQRQTQEINHRMPSTSGSNATSTKALNIHGRPEVMNLIDKLAPPTRTSYEHVNKTDNSWCTELSIKWPDLRIIEFECHQAECKDKFTDISLHAKHMYDAHMRHPYICPFSTCISTHTNL